MTNTRAAPSHQSVRELLVGLQHYSANKYTDEDIDTVLAFFAASDTRQKVPNFDDAMLARGVSQYREAMKHPALSAEAICGMIYDGMTYGLRDNETSKPDNPVNETGKNQVALT